MNPPYGGDKSKSKAYKFAYSVGKGKEKRFLVNQDIQSIGVEDHDKVSAGVQLAMATLAPEGVCCIVLPQGFFFGASAKAVELRQKLAEEYKIHYVVDIASGSFINTGTKTSMLVFQKGVGPTDTVQFIGLDESLLVEATLEQLREKNYSLNYKQYLPQEVVEMDGVEMVRLGDVCYTKNGFAIKSENMTNNTTDYPVIKVKNLQNGTGVLVDNNDRINIKHKDDFIVKKGDVLIVMVGNTAGKMAIWEDEDAYLNQNIHKIHFNEKVIPRYVFYILNTPSFLKQIIPLSSGTAQPFISPSSLYEIRIPLPSLAKQQEIVEAIDGYTQLAHAEEQSLKLLEKSVMFWVKEMGQGKERVKLGEVCEFQRGKMITKKELVEGEFPVIGGGLTPMGYHNLSNRIAYTILISQSGENAGHISRYTKPVWASDCFSVSSSKMNDDYLYYSLLQIQDNINFLKTGTAQPHIYPSIIDTLEIPLPSLAEQQTLQSDFDEIRHKHAKIAEYKAKAQEAIQRLIPGANRQEPTPNTSEAPVESHSSTCAVQEDGTGCTCRVSIVEETESIAVESPSEPAVAALPSSTQENASVTKKKIKRPVAAKASKMNAEVE
jgi:type I restriction enzyme S subunit